MQVFLSCLDMCVFFATTPNPDVSSAVIRMTVTSYERSASLYLKYNKTRIIIYNYPPMHVSSNQCHLEDSQDD